MSNDPHPFKWVPAATSTLRGGHPRCSRRHQAHEPAQGTGGPDAANASVERHDSWRNASVVS
jgi:hypothetical protein